ncbi:MAG: flagellar hook-length control protein FliK [Xanthobacteraceae bacterium]
MNAIAVGDAKRAAAATAVQNTDHGADADPTPAGQQANSGSSDTATAPANTTSTTGSLPAAPGDSASLLPEVIAAAAAAGASASTDSPAAATKKSPSDTSDDQQDASSTAANATAATGAAANLPTAVAAAVTVSNLADTQGPANGSPGAIAGIAGQRGRSGQTAINGQLAVAAQTSQASDAAHETPGAAQGATQAAQHATQGTNATPSPTDAAKQAAAANVAPNANSAVPQPSAGTAAPSGDANALPANLVVRLDAAANGTLSAPASNTQDAVKSAGANLPSFAVLVTNAATTQTAAGTAAPAAAVSIAGLPIAIAARIQAGTNQFDIRLDPPELGRIDVRLSVDGSGQVTSHVTVDRPETLTLLQSQQPQLQRALEQAGLKTADNGLQFTLRDQSFAGQNNNGGGTQPNPTPQLVIPDSDLPPVDAAQIYSRWGHGTGVDITV